MAHNRLIVKKRVVEAAERLDVESTGDDPAYQDLMQSIEGDVQQVLEEEGIIEF